MAKITFSLDELVEILLSNKLLPGRIIRPKVEAGTIHFVIQTNLPILQYIPATLRYLSFNDNNATFELAIAGGRLDSAASWLNQVVKSEVPAYIRFEYPKIVVDVDKLLEEKNVKGIRVKDIFFEQGQFSIVTCNI